MNSAGRWIIVLSAAVIVIILHNNGYRLPKESNDFVRTGKTPPIKPIRYGPAHSPTNFAAMNKIWLLVIESRNVAFNFIPKVMCSSIRSVVSYMECTNKSKTCAEWRRAKHKLTNARFESMTRVVMLRDPLERAFSAFENSASNGYITLPGCRNIRYCSFAEWIDIIYHNSSNFVNEHFLPETKVAQLDKVHYHYVLRMSSAIDRAFLWNDVLNASSTKLNSATKDQSIMVGNMTEGVVQQLVELYRDDLKVWSFLSKYGTPKEERTLYDIISAKYPLLFEEFRNVTAPTDPRTWVFPELLAS